MGCSWGYSPMSSVELLTVSVQNARVILLAGPSGSGKSYVARRTGLPVLCLDDFYKDGTDPTLPQAQGIVDWESPESWNAEAAIAAIAELSASGQALIPVYDIGQSARVADRLFAIDDQSMFVAEGIFAAELVTRCAELGLLADAIALKRPRTVTFTRRLVRDLAEHRKAPSVLFRRGIRLFREDPTVLGRAYLLGCRPMSARKIWARVESLKSASRTRA